jgi:hypothetical protein
MQNPYKVSEVKHQIHHFTTKTQFSKVTYNSWKKCVNKNTKNIGKCFYGYHLNNLKDTEKIAWQTSSYGDVMYTHFEVFSYYFVGFFLPLLIGFLTVALVYGKIEVFQPKVLV